MMLWPISMKAADPVRVHGIYYELIGDEATVTSGSITYSGVLAIPSSFNYSGRTYHVTSIGYQAFYNRTDLISVTIPESVISIDVSAFAGCSGLTTISIPDNVTIISTNAFNGCSRLSSVTIGSGLTSLGAGVFANCTELSTIKVKADNKSFDSRNNCNAIIETSSNKLIAGCKNTIIPSNVTSIEVSAFSGCIGLTSINIPEGVTTIGSSAFSGCSSTSYVIIPSTITIIGDYAFYGCSSLKDVFCYVEKALNVNYYHYNNYGGSSYTTTSFDGIPLSSVTLHVPEASILSYKFYEPWSSFGTIVALTDEDGIANVKADEDAIWDVNANTDEPNPVYYDTNGRKSDRPHHGINIIRYSDGTTRKVIMR